MNKFNVNHVINYIKRKNSQSVTSNQLPILVLEYLAKNDQQNLTNYLQLNSRVTVIPPKKSAIDK